MDYWHTLSLHYYTWQKSTAYWMLRHEAQFQLLSNTMLNNRISQVKGYIIWQNAYILHLNRILHFLNRHNRIWTNTCELPTNLVSTILHKWIWTISSLRHFRKCNMTSSFNVWAAIPRKPERPKKKRMPVSFGFVPESNKHRCQTYTGSNTKPFSLHRRVLPT